MSTNRAVRLVPIGETVQMPAPTAEERAAYQAVDRAGRAQRSGAQLATGRPAAALAAARLYAAINFR